MKQSFAQLLRAFLFALLCAAGYATVDLLAQNVCGSPLACFEPGQEGEIWQALEPFGQTNDAACTNSEHPNPNRVREDSRQCSRTDEQDPAQLYPVLMPPSLGQMLDPFALAVDGETIYVSDQSNHRVQAFKFDGTPIKIAHPIGDGVMGSGPYPAYPADSRMTGNSDPITGQRLYSPDGLAVDANHKLVVGDFSGYLNVFNPDGTPAFGTMSNPERLQIVDTVSGDVTKASGIAMTPGTVVQGIGVPPPAGDTSRIVVTDRLNCFVYIYDSGFNLVKQIPDHIPADAYQGACVWTDVVEPAPPLGVFSSPVAAAIDNAGHIYISDYDNNRIQILDLAGNALGEFGRDSLQYPWGVVADHRGRVAVADTENQRVAFFQVDYSGATPNPQYIFELDAAGTLDGYPTAIAEQVGTSGGLDPAGRLLVTDTLNNRIQRFQLPDLAVINPSVDTSTFTGTFQVVVPADKASAVQYVGVSAVGTNATVTSLNGLAPANTAVLNPLDTALQNATAALGTTIAPGQIATYAFTFTPDGQGEVAFAFNAVGNGGTTAADERGLSVPSPCLDCASTHEVFKAAVPPTELASPSNGWYNTALTIRVNATTTHPDGLLAIAYQFVSGPESAGQRWGGGVHTIAASGPAASTDFNIISEGASTFRYWAIGADGSVEASHTVTVSLDLTPPTVAFTLTPGANGAGWNNQAVSGTFVHQDGRSGPVFTGTGTFAFTGEGRDQFVEQQATDRAGNTRRDEFGNLWPYASNLTANGGRVVNIDMTPPAFDSLPADITIPATGSGFGVISPGAFDATASDPPLNDSRSVADKSGSGVVSITNPGTFQFPIGVSTWTFVATDAAGNAVQAQRTVTVQPVSAAITYTGATTVQYGQTLNVGALVTPSFASGAVTFTLAGRSPVTGTLSGGAASSSIPLVLNNVGTYALTVSYGGDSTVTAVSTSVNITVTPAPISVRAQDQTKVAGTADPALTSVVTSGTLFGSDTFSGALARVAGELPGTYAINQGTFSASSNYQLTFTPGTFTITGYAVSVFADYRNKSYGDLDPVLTYSFVPALPPGVGFEGALVRETGENAGNYRINQGNLSLPSGFNLVYHSATFSIVPREATVTAGNATKVFGTADPAIPVTSSGFLPGETITISATRAAGENAGLYSTLAHVAGANLSNYSIGLQSGSFTITPATVTVTAQPQTITYGDGDPVFGVAYGPFPAGYSAASVTTPPVCGVAGAHSNAGSYSITCAGAVADNNIQFTYAPGVLSVLAKNVTLTIDAASRLFGAANPAFTATTSGLVGEDALNYSLASTALALSPVGSYPITATLGANPNYDVAVTSADLTIDPAPVTIVANAQARPYGQPNPTLDAVVTGAVSGAPVLFSLATPAVAASPVGGYPITVNVGVNPNYVVTAANSTLVINALPITITAASATVVYGDAEPPLTYGLSSALVAGDAVTGSLSRAAGTDVGDYAITQGSLALNANYEVTFVGGTLTISKRAATITALNNSKTEGGLDPLLLATSSGFLPADSITVTATRAPGEAPGMYAIVPVAAGAKLGNYLVTVNNGVFTIVANNQPPFCGNAYGGEIWPPNHKRFYVAPINGVTDPDGQAVTIVVTGIWQDELLDSTGDGKFSPDARGVGTSTAWVRAERNGKGNKARGDGRVYEILFTATDTKGAQCTGSVFWTVPHDQGQGSSAIDSGVRYDSTGVIPGARDKSQIHQNSPTP